MRLQAAILNVKIRHLDYGSRGQGKLQNTTKNYLSGTDLILPVEKTGYYHIYHQYTVRVQSGRDALHSYLADCGIE